MNYKRLSFVAEWYQQEAAITRTFLISFYTHDNAVEVFDQRSKKTFLRRTKVSDLSETDFFVGSKINVFGRQFDIIDYADEITKNTLAKYRKKTFVLLKHSLWTKYFGKLLIALMDSNLNVNNGMMVQFTPKAISMFLGGKNKGDVHASVLMNELLAGPAIGLELIGDNVTEIINACQNKDKTDITIPPALAGFFEKEETRNGFYCAENDEEVEMDIKFFFLTKNNILKECAYKNSTLAVIKPHCIKEDNLGRIIDEILSNGFKINAMRMLLLARVNCEEFYEVYRGILPEYIPMVAQLASGLCMCLEIISTDPSKNTHKEFRDFCGPMDPEIAKLLRPHTLRAKFGQSKILNAVHCTDLPDDTNLELQYLFKILD